MSKQMKIGTKIGLGFGLLIAIAMILGGLAVVNMKKVAVESTKLSLEYVLSPKNPVPKYPEYLALYPAQSYPA